MDFLKPHLLEAERNSQSSLGVLISIFHSLLRSILYLFVDQPLTTTQLLVFIQKVAETFPSSSNSSQSRFISIIGDILVDVYWSVELQIEEQLNAFKTIIERQAMFPETANGNIPVVSPGVPMSSDEHRRAEIDKSALNSLLRGLLVSILFTFKESNSK